MNDHDELIAAEDGPWPVLLLVVHYWPFSKGVEMRGFAHEVMKGTYFRNGYNVYMRIPEPINRVTSFGRG